MEDTIKRLYQGLEEGIERFQSNPYDYLYESDLQASIFQCLFDRFKGAELAMKGTYKRPLCPEVVGEIRTNAVKSEYPTGLRFDLAIIDPDVLRTYDPARDKDRKNDLFWDQPVRVALELKYCQIGDDLESKLRGVSLDRKKLERYLTPEEGKSLPIARPPRFLGIAMLFVQASETMRSTKWEAAKKRHISFELKEWETVRVNRPEEKVVALVVPPTKGEGQ